MYVDLNWNTKFVIKLVDKLSGHIKNREQLKLVIHFYNEINTKNGKHKTIYGDWIQISYLYIFIYI